MAELAKIIYEDLVDRRGSSHDTAKQRSYQERCFIFRMGLYQCKFRFLLGGVFCLVNFRRSRMANKAS